MPHAACPVRCALRVVPSTARPVTLYRLKGNLLFFLWSYIFAFYVIRWFVKIVFLMILWSDKIRKTIV